MTWPSFQLHVRDLPISFLTDLTLTSSAEYCTFVPHSIKLALGLPLVTATTALGRVTESAPCFFTATTQPTAVSGLGPLLAEDAGELDET